jgi:hypothetical protein
MATTHTVAASGAASEFARAHVLRRVFSFPVYLGALLVAGGFVGARSNLADPDTWWHLKVGEQILRTHAWPTADSYSFTVFGIPWMAYEWLGEVIMASAARLGGLRAPTVLLVALVGTLLVLLYYYAALRSGKSKAAFVACALVLPVASAFFTLRPQLLGYIFLLVALICLEHFRRGRLWTLWVLPPLFLLWVNTHGTFVFGLMVLGLTWACGQAGFSKGGLVAERWTPAQSRRLVVIILLCVLVLPLTPYGTRLAAYPLEMSLYQPFNTTNIQEWQPLAFNLLLGKVFLGLLLLFFLTYALQQPRFRVDDVALLLFGVFAACVHLRFTLMFLLFFAPLLAVLLARWMPAYQPAKDRFGLNAVLVALIASGLVFFFPSNGELRKMVAKKYPQEAVEYLRAHAVAGPMLNEYGWGGYLIWTLGPERKVFIDGRADIYEYSGVFSDYLDIVRLEPDAFALLRKYDIQACLIARKAALSTVLAALPDWQAVYTDETAVLYVHKRRQAAPED